MTLMNSNVHRRAAGLLAFGFASCSFGAERMPLLMPDDFSELNLVAWRVEPGTPDPRNPLLEPAAPWDAGGIMGHGTVAKDPIDGLWKAWQISTPPEETMEELESKHAGQRRLTYLTSKDGVQWERPQLPLVKWPGYELTNLLLDLPSGGTSTYASVLIDPKNKSWPYEMFVMRAPKFGPTPDRVGHLPPPRNNRATYRYRSKDGVSWELMAGPIYPAPGGDVCYVYKLPDGTYVSYFKMSPPPGPGDRLIPYDNNPEQMRKVGRRTSVDGNDWTGEVMVLQRDWRDPDLSQFLEICPLPVAGGYVATVNHYNPSIQTMELQFAASRDGIRWWRPDRRPALPNAPLGDYGGGMIWQMRQPIVADGRLYVYYGGTEGIHGEIHDTRFGPRVEVGGETVIGTKTPTLPFNSALCRASWRFDRLWALVPSAGGVTIGMAVTKPQACAGRELWINALGKPRGRLIAELLDASGRPLPDFSRADCTPIEGDRPAARLSWKGGTKAPRDAAKVRFILQRAFLYGFEWRG